VRTLTKNKSTFSGKTSQ